MSTTTSPKAGDERALPKRDPKTGRFEKGAAKAAKPAVPKPKPTMAAKPAAKKPK